MDKKVYRAKVRIGHTEDGKPIDKYITAHSPEELEKKKEATRQHYVYGKPIPKQKITWIILCRIIIRPSLVRLTIAGAPVVTDGR